MQTSYEGLEFIKKHEGFRDSAYDDATGKKLNPGEKASGNATIGYGHMIKPTETFAPKIPESFASALLREDVKQAEHAVSKAVQVLLNQRQFDALVSFTYNAGAANLASSTLLKRLNNRDYDGAADEFMRWVFATARGVKVKLPGLVKRREAERKLFLTKP